MKKNFTTPVFIALAIAASLTLGLTMSKRSVSANNAATAATTSAASVSLQQSIQLPATPIYAVDVTNGLYVLRVGQTSFSKVGQISGIGNANVIGIDFRVADGKLYAITDQATIYTLNLSNAAATLSANNLAPRFAGGVQSLCDFNPVANALRLIGSNDQNFAQAGANLGTTVPQTKVAYVAGDRNANADPNLASGTYSNNFVGATTTIFYAVDYDTDNFVTIANLTNGSSATGGGQLRSIGLVFDNNNIQGGTAVNFTATSDMDIFTDRNNVNTAIIFNNNRLIVLPISQVNINAQPGQQQNLGAFGANVGTGGATGFEDIAVQPIAR